MANQLLEFFVRHNDVERATAIDEAGDFSADVKNQKSFGVLRNTLFYPLQRCSLVALIGGRFDLEASLGIIRDRASKGVGGGHRDCSFVPKRGWCEEFWQIAIPTGPTPERPPAGQPN